MPPKRERDGHGTLNENNNSSKQAKHQHLKVTPKAHATRSYIRLHPEELQEISERSGRKMPDGHSFSGAFGRFTKFKGMFVIDLSQCTPDERAAIKEYLKENQDIADKELTATPNGKNRQSPGKTVFRQHSSISTSIKGNARTISFFKNSPQGQVEDAQTALLEKFAIDNEEMVDQYCQQIQTLAEQGTIKINLPDHLLNGSTVKKSVKNFRLTKEILQWAAAKNNRDITQKQIYGKSARELAQYRGLTNVFNEKKSLVEISHMVPASFGGLICTREEKVQETDKKHFVKKQYKYTPIDNQALDITKYPKGTYFNYAQLKENVYVSDVACNTRAMLYEMLCRYLAHRGYVVMLNIDVDVYQAAPEIAKHVYYSIVWGHENEQGVFQKSNHLDVDFAAIGGRSPSTHDYAVLLTIVKFVEAPEPLMPVNQIEEDKVPSSPQKPVSQFFTDNQRPISRQLFPLEEPVSVSSERSLVI